MDRFYIISSMVLLSFCFLSAASAESSPYDLAQSGPINVSTSYAIGSADHQIIVVLNGSETALTLNLKYSVGDRGPVCFLEILENTNTTYWTKPCPRSPQLLPPVGFWCQFEFTLEGNLRLMSGPNDQNKAENPTLLWGSGTTGLGGQILKLVEGTTSSGSDGNLHLYKANGRDFVWGNIYGRTALDDYRCTWDNQTQTFPAPIAPPAPAPVAGRKLLEY